MKSAAIVVTSVVLAITLPAVQGRTQPSSIKAEDRKRILQRMEGEAETIKTTADALWTYASDYNISKDSHSEALMTIGDAVNSLGRDMHSLDISIQNLPTWEQRTADGSMPTLKGLAATFEATFQYFEKNPQNLQSSEYRRLIEDISKESEKLREVLRDDLRLAKIHDEERKLDQNLHSEGVE